MKPVKSDVFILISNENPVEDFGEEIVVGRKGSSLKFKVKQFLSYDNEEKHSSPYSQNSPVKNSPSHLSKNLWVSISALPGFQHS